MKLYTYWRSSAAFRGRLALALKGIEAEHVAINLAQGDQWGSNYTKINHQSIVPTLEDGGLVIRQSLSLIHI